MQQLIESTISKEALKDTNDRLTLIFKNNELAIDKLSEKLDVTIKQADQTSKALA